MVIQEAMSFKEIGHALGLREKTVKTYFHDGMKKLRRPSRTELSPVVEYVAAARALADRIDNFRGFEE